MSTNLITGYAGKAHITSGGDGAVNAALFGKGRYVLDIGEHFSYEIISNNLIRIKSGYAINQGRKIELAVNDYEELTIDNGLQGVKRCDLIAITYEKNLETGIETAVMNVIKGTSGDDYLNPEHTVGNILNGDAKDDFLLYRVKINGLSIESVEKLFDVRKSLIESDTAENTATFTSSDVADGSVSAWTNVPKLSSGEKHSSIFAKMSQMFKNVRYLYKMLGTTDISKIGNGTCTGAISSLNDGLVKHSHTWDSITGKPSAFPPSSSDLLNKIYPVGSIYMSINNVSPQTFIGGTWEQIKNRWLVGAGDEYAVGTYGGNAVHSHTQRMIFTANYAGNNGLMYTAGGTTPTDVIYTGETRSVPPYYAVYMWKRIA